MRQLIIALGIIGIGAGCLASSIGDDLEATDNREVIMLPTPRTAGPLSLEETLAQRRSVRSFVDTPLTQDEIAQLLWAAQGITRDWGGRTAPSAGALYPLELYIITEQRAGHYSPQEHAIAVVAQGDLRPAIWAAGLKQDPLLDAPVTIVIASVQERTRAKYGERAERYVLLEAGHAAQNILLQAVALDLGAVPIGAFHDEEIASSLDLPAGTRPLYLIAIGHPQPEPEA